MSPRFHPTCSAFLSGLRFVAATAASAAALAILPHPAAAGVTGISAVHRSGQTFITWDNPAGTGWTYRVYVSTIPFQSGRDFADATLLGSVGDSSSMNRRLSTLLGAPVRYRIDSLAAPLSFSQGLFAATTVTAQKRYYAVTTQAAGGPEQRTVVPGDNTNLSPLIESIGAPKPVWQTALTSPQGDVYAIWTSTQATPMFAATCNKPNRAYLFGVKRGTAGGPLIVHGHGRGGSFFNSLSGASLPGQWVLAIDDYVDSGDLSTFYFGYHEQYDIDHGPGLPPISGMVRDYTEQRTLYLLRWARKDFPVDTNRVYVMGVSMGGTFAMLFAWHYPELIAAAWAQVPRISLGYIPDSSPLVRESFDRMWGTVPTDLTSSTGVPVFDWIDGRSQAVQREAVGGAPIIAFNGRNDDIVGWPEMVSYYNVTRAHRAGGSYFWDNRDHNYSALGGWLPIQNPSALGRFRLDRSYPAISACSVDDDPGTGTPTTGDTLGTINGRVDWNDAVTDSVGAWEVTLFTRSLQTRWGTLPAPDSATVDVTPRRLQHFPITQGGVYAWQALRLPDRTLLKSGFAGPDAMGLVTVRGVPVRPAGVALRLTPTGFSSAPAAGASALRLALGANPVRSRAALHVTWPASGASRVELYDASGRRVRTVFAGFAGTGPATLQLDATGLPAGVYVLAARQGAARANRLVVVIP